ncbi:Hypothetical predicted protein [Paramuricea clavata]|uniref:Uncharacterized protein n=1 Tax=Paramuricea clavata TaxID=317549 RepID=A0A6S7HKK8_PARCT|nr:Hypothetical predicted protein [Paramuricea clavata]
MSESVFEAYLFKERGRRWQIKLKLEKLERKLNYLLSEDNNACFGNYLIPLENSKATDIDHCERGVKEISLIEEIVLKVREDAKSKLRLNLSTSKKAFAAIASRKKSSLVKRRKENKRKTRKRKKESEESAVKRLLEQLVDNYTFKNLCFPDGNCKETGSQHAITEDELNLEVLQNLKTKSSIRVLELLYSQSCFALDALPVIGQTMDRLEAQ